MNLTPHPSLLDALLLPTAQPLLTTTSSPHPTSNPLNLPNPPNLPNSSTPPNSSNPLSLKTLLAPYPPYIDTELRTWLFKKYCFNPDAYTNFPKSLRTTLKKSFPSALPLHLTKTIHSTKDKTKKFLFKTQDNQFIETVLIDNHSHKNTSQPPLKKPTSLPPSTSSSPPSTYTLCISSQIGCPLSCDFCATGMMKFTRNLTPAEILAQYLLPAATYNIKISHIVFMGMGEPLLNLKNVFAALTHFTAPLPNGLALSARRISISTSGILNGIEKLTTFKANIRLSISLHSALQHTRNIIMPDLKNVSLPTLKQTLIAYSRNKRAHPLLIEYIMIKNLNDDATHLTALISFLKAFPCKVNLIAYNHVPTKPYQPSPPERIRTFASALIKAHITTTQRFKKGDDIKAACGQLAILPNPPLPTAPLITAQKKHA
ncbi:hypothetical protein COTS27_01223 [Spirochaetota bacterium]|nr:hypothetical protein COTS27_01223 [Spirochaetota bacterium]